MHSFRRVVLVLGSVLLCSAFALGQARLGPYVVDSNGLKVGHAQDLGNILLFIGGKPTVVSAGTLGFIPAPYNLLYVDGACGGQALLESPVSNPLIAPGQYTTDGVIRYFDPGAVSNTIVFSVLPVNEDGTFGACVVTNHAYWQAPALTTSVSGFTPPFSVVDALPVSPAPGAATFNDVPTNHPFFQFVEALRASGITAGCQAAPPLYCPDNPVTRGQMAVFLAKALGL